MDITFWRGIIDSGYLVPSTEDIRRLAADLVGRLGSPDPEWRERVAYPVLEHWIHRGYFRPDDLHELIGQLLGNLRVGLGEADTDTVFMRSYACLVLAEVLYEDVARPFLSEGDIRRVLEHVIAYYPAEADLRGYVTDRGWAHAVANGADLLWVLALHARVDPDDRVRILYTLGSKIAPAGAPLYAWNEDQRLARAVLGVLGRGTVAPTEFASWLDKVAMREGLPMSVEAAFEGNPPGCVAGDWSAAMLNLRNALTAMAFHLAHDDVYASIDPEYAHLLVEALMPLQSA